MLLLCVIALLIVTFRLCFVDKFFILFNIYILFFLLVSLNIFSHEFSLFQDPVVVLDFASMYACLTLQICACSVSLSHDGYLLDYLKLIRMSFLKEKDSL